MHKYIRKLKDLQEYTEQSIINRNLLKMIGSFWEDYFPDLENIIRGNTGVVFLQSNTLDQLLDLCLSSNIIDFPYRKKLEYELFLFQEENLTPVYDNSGDLEYYSMPISGFQDLEYLTSSLIDPEVALEKGKDFEVVGSELRLYVDLFNDPDIFDFTYRAEDVYARHVILWGLNVLLDTEHIYERFGKFLYIQEPDTEEYKQTITALLYFYTNTKSVKRIEAAVNIIFGAPFSSVDGERVTSISGPYSADEVGITLHRIESFNKIETTHSTYYSPRIFEILVEEGDVLTGYQLLSRFHRVDDYISDPEWYIEAPFPYSLIDPESIDDPEFGNKVGLFPYRKYNEEIKYDGNYEYDANMISFQDWIELYEAENLRQIRVDIYESEWGKYLYNLMDKVLKYNIFYIRTRVSFETWDYFEFVRDSLINFISDGIPTYIYPLLDSLFESIEEELYQFEPTELDLSLSYNDSTEYEFKEDHLNNIVGVHKSDNYPDSIWYYNDYTYYDGRFLYGTTDTVYENKNKFDTQIQYEDIVITEEDFTIDADYIDVTEYTFKESKNYLAITQDGYVDQFPTSDWYYNGMKLYKGEFNYSIEDHYRDNQEYTLESSFDESVEYDEKYSFQMWSDLYTELEVQDDPNHLNIVQDPYEDEFKFSVYPYSGFSKYDGQYDYNMFEPFHDHFSMQIIEK